MVALAGQFYFELRVMLIKTVLSLCIFMSCCVKSDVQKFELEGGWYIIRDDSIYSEVMFHNNVFYSYDENSGNTLGYFSLEGDNLAFFDRANNFTLSGKITVLDSVTFTLITKYYSASFARLGSPIKMDLLFEEDEEYINEYLEGFYTRRETWMLERKE
jgi:hypothetical protein